MAIRRQDRSRTVRVDVNLRGRELVSWVADARAVIARAIPLPAGYRIGWGGQFENFERAKERLKLVVPAAVLLIFAMLLLMFKDLRLAIAVFVTIPFALTGGMLGLLARGYPFSLSAAVGFIALGGIAVLNGVVIASELRRQLAGGHPPLNAITRALSTAFWAVLTTAALASFGCLPMARATTAGAEVQRPLAMVVIVGILVGTLITLTVLSGILWVVIGPRWRHAARAPLPPDGIEACPPGVVNYARVGGARRCNHRVARGDHFSTAPKASGKFLAPRLLQACVATGRSAGLPRARSESVQRQTEWRIRQGEASGFRAAYALVRRRLCGRPTVLGMLVSLLISPACAHDPDMSTSLQTSAQAIPSGPTLNVAVMNVGGVRLYARGDGWDGTPANLGAQVTPVAVRIENHSGGPIELLYDRLALVSADGQQFHPLPLLPLAGRAGSAAPLQPAYRPAGFFIAPRFAPAYNHLPAWRTNLARDESLYRLDYRKWGAGLPSFEVVTKGLPEGVLEDGGTISGFLYFDPEAREHHDLTFQADLTDGDWERRVALIEIPFRIQ